MPSRRAYDQPGRAQHGQVLADRRPRHVEPGRDHAGGELAIREEAEDLPAARLRQGLEGLVDHGQTLATL